ncbi:apoptosis-inducing factor 1, mitochondrial-like [Mercenaria mercenaria]|uniref:apoptosis-inducing factor 1, mitochondrial-like n=1 Tax=Mercenaria mercenaria TaxID=6596 RepID=UPI00234F9246|nr:apoptosis-inducing factor 1, mitochondrial-like [Mercenaria mercenaria]
MVLGMSACKFVIKSTAASEVVIELAKFSEGIDTVTGVSIKSAVYENGKVRLGLNNGKHVEVDHVVVAVGIEPNTDLADSGNLELDDKFGGFRVNTELQARSDIWAAGDCASFYDIKLGRRRVEHFDHASVTGRLAGFNMAGENRPYQHQSMFWSTLGGIVDYEAVGLVDSRLQTFSAFRKTSPEEDSIEKEDNAKSQSKRNVDTDNSKSTGSKKSQPTAKPVEKTQNSEQDDYNNGVIFYLRDGEVVGVVLWNLAGFMGDPSRLDIARQVIADGAKGKDLTEVAKLFNVYAN